MFEICKRQDFASAPEPGETHGARFGQYDEGSTVLFFTKLHSMQLICWPTLLYTVNVAIDWLEFFLPTR